MNIETQGYHLFNTASNLYIYDVLTNNIYKTDRATYHKLQAGRNGSIIELNSIIRNGHNNHSIAFEYPLKDDVIRHELSYGLNQLVLEITENCNLRCKYCIYSGKYNHERMHSAKSMSKDIAFNSINYFLQHSKHVSDRRFIGFYGGEPLMCFDLIKMCIQLAREQSGGDKVKFSITTNGTLLTPEKFQFLIDEGIFLHISLDGPPDIHDQNRITKTGLGSFRTIAQNLQLLLNFDPQYYFQNVLFLAVLTDYSNLHVVNNFINESVLTASNTVIINRVGVNDTLDNCILQELNEGDGFIFDQYYAGVASCGDPGKFMRYQLDQMLRNIHERGCITCQTAPPNGICIPGVRKLYVRTDGSIYPCERLGFALKLGSIFTGIDEGKVNKIIREYEFLCNTACTNCWAARLCSACFAHARDGYGMSLNRKKSYCDGIRKNVDFALRLYAQVCEANPTFFENRFSHGKKIQI